MDDKPAQTDNSLRPEDGDQKEILQSPNVDYSVISVDLEEGDC